MLVTGDSESGRWGSLRLIGKKTFSVAYKLSEDDSDFVMETVLLLYSITTYGQKLHGLHYSFVYYK